MAMASCSAWLPEGQRIRLAHLFDPVLAVHTSIVDPLPPPDNGSITIRCCPDSHFRFLLADDPGAGKTIMAGLLIKELSRTWRLGTLFGSVSRKSGLNSGRTSSIVASSFHLRS